MMVVMVAMVAAQKLESGNWLHGSKTCRRKPCLGWAWVWPCKHLERGYFQSWINCIITSYKSLHLLQMLNRWPQALATLPFFQFSQVSVPPPTTVKTRCSSVQTASSNQNFVRGVIDGHCRARVDEHPSLHLLDPWWHLVSWMCEVQCSDTLIYIFSPVSSMNNIFSNQILVGNGNSILPLQC